MGTRQETRKASRELKGKGLPFVLRHALAKASARFDRHADVLRRKGFTCVRSYGCECCDPNITQIWEGVFQDRTYRITTEWGVVEWCDRI
jgi:hypothetical protein